VQEDLLFEKVFSFFAREVLALRIERLDQLVVQIQEVVWQV